MGSFSLSSECERCILFSHLSLLKAKEYVYCVVVGLQIAAANPTVHSSFLW